MYEIFVTRKRITFKKVKQLQSKKVAEKYVMVRDAFLFLLWDSSTIFSLRSFKIETRSARNTTIGGNPRQRP
jgi:hypothetical protein